MSYTVGKGKPPKHTQFKKGVSGNPDGGRRHDPVKKLFKNVTAPEFEEVINVALTSNPGELKQIIQNQTSSSIKVGIATSLLKAIQKGDWRTLNAIIERVVGKTVVKVDHTSGGKTIESSAQVHLYLPANGKTKDEAAS